MSAKRFDQEVQSGTPTSDLFAAYCAHCTREAMTPVGYEAFGRSWSLAAVTHRAQLRDRYLSHAEETPVPAGTGTSDGSFRK